MAQSIFANDNHSHYASYVDSKVSLSVEALWLRKNNKTSVLLIIIILAMILGVVKIQVWLNDWNNDFFNALSQKETDKLWQLVLWFPALLDLCINIRKQNMVN